MTIWEKIETLYVRSAVRTLHAQYWKNTEIPLVEECWIKEMDIPMILLKEESVNLVMKN